MESDVDHIDCTWLGGEKFLSLKALRGLKEEGVRQAVSLSIQEKSSPMSAGNRSLEPNVPPASESYNRSCRSF